MEELAAVFHRAAAGQPHAGDPDVVAHVLQQVSAHPAGKSQMAEEGARRFGTALCAAIRAGSPGRETLQAFLDFLGAGTLSVGPVVCLLPCPGARVFTIRLAEATLQWAWPALVAMPCGIQGTFTAPSPQAK